MNDPWTAARAAGETIITFPQPAALLNMNHRHHWRQTRNITRAWRFAACQAAGLLGTRSQRAHGGSWVQLEVPVPDRRRRDPANLMPLVKAVVDGCVDAGVWPDDTPEWVTTIEPRLIVDKPPKGYPATVRILIWPRAAGLPPAAAFTPTEVH